MTDRPIIFSGPMVLALLDGRKTQTRRLATSPLRKCQPGDRLYAREAWRMPDSFDPHSPLKAYSMVDPTFGPNVFYSADGSIRSAGAATGRPGKLRPSIHMPRWASRLTLTVTVVRVEPLQAISEQDAIAEGIVEHETCGWHVPGLPHPMKAFPIFSRPSPREMYAALWDELHGSGEWLGNPDVLALEFSVVAKNIDRLAA